MRPQTGKRPQAPSNRPLQPLKRQWNKVFASGQAIREASLTVLRPTVHGSETSRTQKRSLCGLAASSGVLNPQGNKKGGQPRKLCLLGGVLPRRYKPLILKEYLMRSFRGRFFRPCGIFEEGRISGFWGDLRGAFDQARPHARAFLSRETGPFVAFP